MKIDSFLNLAAAGKLQPGYLLAGAEVFFRDKAREAVIQFFLQGHSYDLVDRDLAEVPVRDALDEAATVGLFASRHVFWLRSAESLLPRRGARSEPNEENESAPRVSGKHSLEAITSYFARPNRDALVIFEARLEDRDRIDRLQKLLACEMVGLDPPEAHEAARYLVEDARRGGYVLDARAAREIVEFTGGGLARARMELEKLMTYSGERRTLTAADVRSLVPAQPTYLIWELGDCIGRRDSVAALERLAATFREGHRALPTLGLIAAHIRKLIRVKTGSADQWVHPDVRRQAERIPLSQLTAALERLFQADLELRSSPPNDRQVLERLVLELCSKPR